MIGVRLDMLMKNYVETSLGGFKGEERMVFGIRDSKKSPRLAGGHILSFRDALY